MAKIKPAMLAPPLIFLLLGGLFFFGLVRKDGNVLPSTMIGRETPSIDLGNLRADPPPTDADLRAPGVKIVNFWASWCPPCRAEHPILTEMAASGMTLYGINYKDAPDNAQGFLDELGDPFTKIGTDRQGRNGIDWGVYGLPETFIVDGNGTILYRHTGAITPKVLEERFMPLIREAEAKEAAAAANQ